MDVTSHAERSQKAGTFKGKNLFGKTKKAATSASPDKNFCTEEYGESRNFRKRGCG